MRYQATIPTTLQMKCLLRPLETRWLFHLASTSNVRPLFTSFVACSYERLHFSHASLLSIFINSSSLCLVVVVVVDLLCSPVMEKCKTDHCVSQQSHFRTQTKTSTLTLFPCRGSRNILVETLTSFGIAFQLASFTTFVVIVVLVVHFLAYAFQHKSFRWLQPPALALFARLCFVLFFVKQWCV